MSAEEIPCPAELDFDEAKNAALGCLLSLSKITSGLLVVWGRSACFKWQLGGDAGTTTLPSGEEITVLKNMRILDADGRPVRKAKAAKSLDKLDTEAAPILRQVVQLYRRVWKAMPPNLLDAMAVASPNQPVVKSYRHEFPTAHEASKHLLLELLETAGIVAPRSGGSFDGWAIWAEDVDPVAERLEEDSKYPVDSRWDSWRSVWEGVRRLPNIDVDTLKTRITTEWANAARPQKPLTRPMTQIELGKWFCCHRNQVKAQVLGVYYYEPIGSKYRLRVEDMPADYRAKHGLTS